MGRSRAAKAARASRCCAHRARGAGRRRLVCAPHAVVLVCSTSHLALPAATGRCVRRVAVLRQGPSPPSRRRRQCRHRRNAATQHRAVRKVALAVFLFVAGFAMLAGGVYLKYTQPGEGRGESRGARGRGAGWASGGGNCSDEAAAIGASGSLSLKLAPS